MVTSDVLPAIELVEEVPAEAVAVVTLAAPDPVDPRAPREAADVVVRVHGDVAEVRCGWDGGTAEELRRAVGAGVRAVRRHRHVAVDARVPAGGVALQAAVDAAYAFAALRSEPDVTTERLSVVVDDVERAQADLVVAQLAAWVRLLVDTPPSHKTPRLLADAIVGVATAVGVTAELWDEQRLAEERCGAVLGVARGSAEPPRLVRLDYRPERPRATVALVGKGVCFDSGGLVLKTGRQMLGMKGDMAGAATAAAVTVAAARLGLDVAVTCWLPLVENMPGSSAIKVEDVVVTRSGRSIEVVDTDAEGRLILADALALAAEQVPDAIVDLATLTGSVVVGLGYDVSALFANDDDLAQRILSAADRAGEPQWRLPIVDRYRSKIASPVADVRNSTPTGGSVADGILAALLLREFVGDVPWAHVDFAGPAYVEDAGDGQTGGTGFGVATLVDVLRSWTSA